MLSTPAPTEVDLRTLLVVKKLLTVCHNAYLHTLIYNNAIFAQAGNIIDTLVEYADLVASW